MRQRDASGLPRAKDGTASLRAAKGWVPSQPMSLRRAPATGGEDSDFIIARAGQSGVWIGFFAFFFLLFFGSPPSPLMR